MRAAVARRQRLCVWRGLSRTRASESAWLAEAHLGRATVASQLTVHPRHHRRSTRPELGVSLRDGLGCCARPRGGSLGGGYAGHHGLRLRPLAARPPRRALSSLAARARRRTARRGAAASPAVVVRCNDTEGRTPPAVPPPAAPACRPIYTALCACPRSTPSGMRRGACGSSQRGVLERVYGSVMPRSRLAFADASPVPTSLAAVH